MRKMVQLFIMVFKIRINKHKFVVVNTFNYPRKSEINEFTLLKISMGLLDRVALWTTTFCMLFGLVHFL